MILSLLHSLYIGRGNMIIWAYIIYKIEKDELLYLL